MFHRSRDASIFCDHSDTEDRIWHAAGHSSGAQTWRRGFACRARDHGVYYADLARGSMAEIAPTTTGVGAGRFEVLTRTLAYVHDTSHCESFRWSTRVLFERRWRLSWQRIGSFISPGGN
jgi:hypothetical protein